MSSSTPLTPTPQFLTIPSKPNAPISYTFFPSTLPPSTSQPQPQKLIIFLNGLGLPASSWLPTIQLLPSHPAILTYDRFGQGLTTSRDPLDSTPGKKEGYGHDFRDVISDLHSLILSISQKHLDLAPSRSIYWESQNNPEDGGPNDESITEDHLMGKLELLIVAASIGVPLARLFIQEYAASLLVTGFIALDSNIANIAYSDIIPDPSSPSFDPEMLDGECSVEEYIHHRAILCSMFDFSVKNPEGLDRRNSPTLLPLASSPKLIGLHGTGPEMTVVGHDPDTFVQMGKEILGTPACISRIVNRHWANYNSDLRKLTEEGKCPAVIIAKGCGHFIQKDDPKLVAELITDMLRRIGW